MQNYKQSCANITYSFSTDVLTASCSSNATPEDIAAYKYSTLQDARQCSTNIANIEGKLQCVPESALVPLAPASDTCKPLVVLYYSKDDKTGSTAPDGVSLSPKVPVPACHLLLLCASDSSAEMPAVLANCICLMLILLAKSLYMCMTCHCAMLLWSSDLLC